MSKFKACIVVTCKGRLKHLKQTLPSMLKQTGCNHQVMVVDFDCPDGTAEWCHSLGEERLFVSKAFDRPLFNLSHARNCGGVDSDADWLAFVDADVFLSENFLSEAVAALETDEKNVLARFPYDETTKRRKLSGTCVVSRILFRQVRGYDEAIQGWGCEESDFYNRCLLHGVTEVQLKHETVKDTVRHSNEDRVAFYEEKDRHASNRVNRAQVADSKRPVNVNGFGVH